ncbi:MAG: peptidoglycan DD-metalloendopeptidase family protein [Bacteroidota bacterium]
MANGWLLYRHYDQSAEPQSAGVASLATSAVAPAAPLDAAIAKQKSEVDIFGHDRGAFITTDHALEPNQTMASLLGPLGATPQQIVRLAEASREVLSLRRLRPGRPITVYRHEAAGDSLPSGTLSHFVYQQDAIRYVTYHLGDSIYAEAARRPVETRVRTIKGTIDGSLSRALDAQGASAALAARLAQIYAWQIDFFHLQLGDAFAVQYEEQYIDGERVGLGRVLGARFVHRARDYYAFRFEKENGLEVYYDEEGESLRKAFLRAPLAYYRLTSRYNPRRFHPVLKRYRAHLGTDYAAPTGTPILATGDGVVTEASYTRGNGNYVKIRHNGTYTTGYLHMSKRGTGIRPGVAVKQGDVIGYVGSTGLATGPHVCYRFWKNGRQVDPLTQELPSADPVDPTDAPHFAQARDQVWPHLRGVLQGEGLVAFQPEATEPTDGP